MIGIGRADLSGKEIQLWRTAPRVVSVVLIPGTGLIQMIENALDDIRDFNATHHPYLAGVTSARQGCLLL